VSTAYPYMARERRRWASRKHYRSAPKAPIMTAEFERFLSGAGVRDRHTDTPPEFALPVEPNAEDTAAPF